MYVKREGRYLKTYWARTFHAFTWELSEIPFWIMSTEFWVNTIPGCFCLLNGDEEAGLKAQVCIYLWWKLHLIPLGALEWTAQKGKQHR